jgi:PhoH-like ATPase
MKKNFVLDTNVLLHDPRSLFSFDDNNVVIPIYVIEEVDKFKRDQSELGATRASWLATWTRSARRARSQKGCRFPAAGS